MRIDINKYWIGYLTGTLILINIFSAGVIMGYALSLDWSFFFWIWLGSTPILMIIRYLYIKQKKLNEEGEDEV